MGSCDLGLSLRGVRVKGENVTVKMDLLVGDWVRFTLFCDIFFIGAAS
jgi:hypothetical protein